MPQPQPVDALRARRSRPRGRRRARGWLIALFVMVAVLGSTYKVYGLRARLRLDQELAFAEQTDPGWNHPAVFGPVREPVPDAEDLVLAMRRAAQLLAAYWPPDVPGAGQPFPPAMLRRELVLGFPYTHGFGDPLPAAMVRAVLADLDQMEPALTASRQLATFHGANLPPRQRIGWRSREGAVPVATEATRVGALLKLDAMVRSQSATPDLALDDLIALRRIGRLEAASPDLYAATNRLRSQITTAELLHRLLSHATCTEEALARLAEDLEAERPREVFLAALRAERAGHDATMAKLAGGTITLEEAYGDLALPPIWTDRMPRAVIESNRGLQLAMFNEAVELARRPFQEQWPAWRLWLDRWGKPPGLLEALGTHAFNNIRMTFEQSVRAQVLQDVSRVAVAAERFRLANGRWPRKGAELAPRYLPTMPTDCFGQGGPLRLEPETGTLLIYSRGPDQVDSGGRVVQRGEIARSIESGPDWGVRLLGPDRRGLPPGASPLPPAVFARESAR